MAFQTTRTRFAPSPTGYIHLGNVRTAVYNALLARKEQGSFILRLDDTDVERSKKEYADAILEDLTWLGLGYDSVVKQSDRKQFYLDYSQELKRKGLLYPCYETPQELEISRQLQLKRGLPPIYSRKSLKLTEKEKRQFEQEGRTPHWRFKLSNEHVSWNDLIKQTISIDCSSLSDPILIREDGTFLYTFTSVVDDMDMGITHIIRGEDHVTNTSVQIQLFKALGAELPKFGHHNLLATIDGKGLSKRDNDYSIRDLRTQGYEPMALVSLAYYSGTAFAINVCKNFNTMIDELDFTKISSSAAKFSKEQIRCLNADLVRSYTYDEVRERLSEFDSNKEKVESFWDVFRDNIEKLADLEVWWKRIYGEQDWPIEEKDVKLGSIASKCLPEEPWDQNTWSLWVKRVQDETQMSRKEINKGLRTILTGVQSGPSMSALLLILPRNAVKRRLAAV